MRVYKRHNIRILHITPHLGGGVGKVILNYLSKTKKNSSFTQRIVCLDYANENAIGVARKVGFSLLDNMSTKKRELLDIIADSDIVLIHTWNHPLLYDFLVREQLPASRVIMWGHNSGFYPPAVYPEKILTYPDMFVFTTPISLETKEVQNLSNENKKSLRVVWSTGGVEHVKSVKPKEHSGFNIGYIGTVDYAKLHPNFLNICNKVNIPEVKFIVCGGSSEKEIKKEAEKLGIAEKFNFTGLVSDITEYLSIFDIFGYLLAPYHYGTCDQVLQESMAAGVVPVVLANPMESYMVKNGVTGIVAKDKNEYIKALQDLYYNPKLRNLLSKNAKEYAIHTFSLEKMVNEWDKLFNEVLDFPKTVRKWKINKKIKDISPKDIFLESLGCYGKNFVSYCNAKNVREKKRAIEKIKKLVESANWQTETKGTVHHYNYFFPNDEYLSFWSKLMKDLEFNKKIKYEKESIKTISNRGN
ncbi:glycosyl transferase, group 1-like protein [Candidatus Shapirobacteria bacterium CG10_big_fil_rev_8_21_14_0_10_40_9]|uniref:Glycosyl transferase, group 1-like protein n=1 Tax=Candidatus Shapirobacteria bacterium CG10_big_fil_rev_8_21_14_0_10_40_9 TaxID=1974888 RepID=A0A2M8L447_9BACT|nr:MAG: glycosyl transferase, group 1-like protein [Candidatus Shapirobacteria bacterium CG10_big_fil_rev_8_21_14_0_10_40_9]